MRNFGRTFFVPHLPALNFGAHFCVRSDLRPNTAPLLRLYTMSTTPLDNVNACWLRISQNSPVYNFFFSDIEIVSAEKGFVLARLKVGPNHINSKGTLHGSVSATIVDWAGGMAIASHGLIKTGLSTDIHVTYVSTAATGDVLMIEGKTSKMGRNMGFTTVTIYKGEEDTQSIVAHGTHTKYILRDVESAKTA
jgi:acyl-coenzyme A thioesterase 13